MADTLPTKFQLTVVTRERRIIDVESDEVELPASDGEIGVLPGHTPLLTTLRVGTMRYHTPSDSEFHRIVISWGFAEILPDRVIVLAERGILPSEVDPNAAEAERLEAEKELAYLSSHDPEFAVVEGRLEEAVAMINVHR
jgi:F-type H+-transporting ATPase subunit epsilon